MAGGSSDWDKLHAAQDSILKEARDTSAVANRTLRVAVVTLVFTVLGILVAIVIAIND